MRRQKLARQAIRAATQVRNRAGVLPGDTACPFDVAASLELGVKFMALPSLEGMYSIEPKPTIVIGSERPAGRKRFTCAHELGHHVFEHGTRFDQLGQFAGDATSDEEYLADNFAAALLMPKSVIDAALQRRGWLRRLFTAEMVFIIARDIGVGYTSLIQQLTVNMRYLSFAQAKELKKQRLPALRQTIAGFPIKRDLLLVDETWGTRPVDVEVGDVLLSTPDARLESSDKGPLRLVHDPKPHFVAQQPGVTNLVLSTRTLQVRVSKSEYSGLAQFRHLEDPELLEGDDET